MKNYILKMQEWGLYFLQGSSSYTGSSDLRLLVPSVSLRLQKGGGICFCYLRSGKKTKALCLQAAAHFPSAKVTVMLVLMGMGDVFPFSDEVHQKRYKLSLDNKWC